jgi:hypothetical protein
VSNLSELLPAGGGQNNLTFTASGAISNGDPVIQNDDGTVSSVSLTSTALGAFYEVQPLVTSAVTCTNPFSGKIVIVYSGASGYGYGVVATVSGSTVSFGTPVVFNSASSSFLSTDFDIYRNKFVIAYQTSNQLKSHVGFVAGTSITFGGRQDISNTASGNHDVIYHPPSRRFAIAYSDSTASFYGYIRSGIVSDSGNSISLTAANQFNAGYTYVEPQHSLVYHEESGNLVIVYSNSSSNNRGSGKAFSMTSTGTIAFGAEATFGSATYGSFDCRSTYDSVNKKVVTVCREGLASDGAYVIGTVSGTTLSFGTETVFIEQNVANKDMRIGFDRAAGAVVISQSDNTNLGQIWSGKLTGDSIALSATSLGSVGNTSTSLADVIYDYSSKKTVLSLSDQSNNGYISSGTFTPEQSNLTSSNFIGLAGQAISDAAEGTINTIGSLNEGQSSLTPSTNYYAYVDGTLTAGPIPYSLNGASFDGATFSFSGQDGNPYSMKFNNDGTKMYMLGNTSDTVYQYSLSTAYDISSAVYDNVSKSVSAQEPNPQSLAFNGDGTRMYVAGSNNQRVYQYDLSTAFNVSTATYNSVSFLVSSQESNPWDILFNNNGTKMYIIGPGSDTVYQYSLSSAYDVSTASYDSVSFSVFAQDTGARGMSFNNDGTALFVTGNSSDAVWQYNLTTAYDMSTASYSGYNFSVAPQENNPSSINFNSDGTKFFVMGWSGDDVNQYSTQVYTDVLVGTAISATKINMKNRS